MRNFAKSLEAWLKGALVGVPDEMVKTKVSLRVHHLKKLLGDFQASPSLSSVLSLHATVCNMYLDDLLKSALS